MPGLERRSAIGKAVLRIDADDQIVHLEPLGHAAKHVLGQGRHQAAGQQMIDAACAAVSLGAAFGDPCRQGIVEAEARAMVVLEASRQTCQLEIDDARVRMSPVTG